MADLGEEIIPDSPFYPDHPLPAELFAGRAEQIDRIMTRGARQVSHGKPVAFYVRGEYGIGKSSLARYAQILATTEYGLHPIYASMGGAREIADVAAVVLEATVRSGKLNPKKLERVSSWLTRYIEKVQLLGVTVNTDALKQDAALLSTPLSLIAFLSDALERLRDTGVTGIFLVLDEINGITRNPQFAQFIKDFWDTNGLATERLPLLLMLCGVETRRREMIQSHESVARIFDIIDIEAMSLLEMAEFFVNAFRSVRMTVTKEALGALTYFSAGVPKIMHLIGDAAFWEDRDKSVDLKDTLAAVLRATDDFGKKYVEQQVLRELQSADYRSILAKIASLGPLQTSFAKAEVVAGLTESEQKKLNNFLQRMKRLGAIESGARGEYRFQHPMVRLYIWLSQFHGQQIETLINDMAQRVGDLVAEDGGTAPL